MTRPGISGIAPLFIVRDVPATRSSMDDFLDSIINMFQAIYRADKRPEARKLTIGCFVIVLIVIVVIGVIYSVIS